MVILRTDSARQTSRAKKLRKLGSETPAFEPSTNLNVFNFKTLANLKIKMKKHKSGWEKEKSRREAENKLKKL